MLITKIEVYKYSIPMVPFTIATGTMYFAQNIFIKIYTNENITGVGECSAFPMIAGETQNTCFELAKDFSEIWIGKNPLDIEARINELHLMIAGNYTAKSAFDLALYDIASKYENKPLYEFLGGTQKEIESDLTIGIDTPQNMATTATEFIKNGVNMIKVKLGKNAKEDVERIKKIREAVGEKIILRIDANQGWSYNDAVFALTEIGKYNIQFCEQPMRKHNDYLLPQLCQLSPVKIMADESVFTHYDAENIIRNNAAAYINIKFAKSGGIHEALKINAVAQQSNIPCMMGGMLESRVALTAKVHFAMAKQNIQFYDLDTCLLGHKIDPVIGGVKYNGMKLLLDETPGIGAAVKDDFLNTLTKIAIQ